MNPYWLKGGDSSEFRISRILTCKLCHVAILHLIYPQKVLNCYLRCFLTKSNFGIFRQTLVLGESPRCWKNFFRKIFFPDLNNFAISQNFLTKLGQLIDNIFPLISYLYDFSIFSVLNFFRGVKVKFLNIWLWPPPKKIQNAENRKIV